ncbi:hypothetical protein [Bacillus sp. FJAT-45037]|uniref:hypothetical protein n=1 Tax=Bacillus sp. FJAT-45037 TaxID=2011007 RepID=UPI000C2407A1|nr:hypothetical protein [Bacillus sp. FJAT-45037]
MSYFRTQSASHCGCGPVAEERYYKKPVKEKKRCEGCFCRYAKKNGIGNFSRVIIDGVLYTTNFLESTLVTGGTGNLVGAIQFVGCPKKKNCCVTFQITPFDAATLTDEQQDVLEGLLGIVGEEALEDFFPGGAPYFLTTDCEKVSGFVFNGNGMGMGNMGF